MKRKEEGWSHLSFLRSDIELQDLEFVVLGFSLAGVKYFLNLPQFLDFEMVMYILCHCIY